MSEQAFDELLNERLERTREVLASKASEYAVGDNRLHNFEKASEWLSVAPETALWGFLTKHLVSLSDMIEKVENGGSYPDSLWEEKIGDTINYLILLEAVVKRKKYHPEVVEPRFTADYAVNTSPKMQNHHLNRILGEPK